MTECIKQNTVPRLIKSYFLMILLKMKYKKGKTCTYFLKAMSLIDTHIPSSKRGLKWGFVKVIPPLLGLGLLKEYEIE